MPLVILLAALMGCGPHRNASKPPDPPAARTGAAGGIRFADEAAQRGIAYCFPRQPRPMRNVEAFGAGCAFLDYDDDGWMDVLLVASPHPVLYRNLGQGRFEDVTTAAGLDRLNGHWTGVAVGDYDGDGRLDLLFTGYHCLALMRNVDRKHFADTTRQAGLDPGNRGHWGSSAAFMDLDGSGRLALLILNYVIMGPKEPQYCELMPGVRSGCPPAKYRPEFPELWQNLGGKFGDVTAQSGLKSCHGKALVVAFADVLDRGAMDFFIGNDGEPADLMGNMGHLRFQNFGAGSGAAFSAMGRPIAAMGADWADYDRDGHPDLVVTAFSNEVYSLLHNTGHGTLEHTETACGLAGPTLKPLGFGAKWVDIDNDGWPDLVFANGHVYDNADQIDPTTMFREPLMIFHNQPAAQGSGREFIDMVPALGGDVARPILGRGSAVGDFDNDGRMDVLVVDYEGAPMLLHNLSTTPNHWITFDLRSSGSNRFAYGAKITAHTGGAVWLGFVSPASSYLSSSDPRVHFGLGSVARLDTVTIRWPDGKTQELRNVAADRILRVNKPK